MNQTSSQSFVFYGDGAAHNKSALRAIRIGLIVGAVITAVVAGVIFAMPNITLGIIAIVFGLYVLVRGIYRLVSGIAAPELTGAGRILSIVIGILLIIAAVFMLRNLSSGIEILGLLIGLSWIIDGIATVIEAARDKSRGFSIGAGIIGVVAGIVILCVPTGGVLFVTYFTGAVFILLAIAQIIAAIRVGRVSG